MLSHNNIRSLFFLFASVLLISGCSEIQFASHVAKSINPPPKSQGTFKVGSPYKIDGKMYYPTESYTLVETGIASWYGPQFHGKQTANGEIFDMNELTAAHRTLQMPSLVRVTNLENGRSLIVRVNDRGPYARGRIIDLSKRAADLLGFKNKGTAKVRLQVLREESMKIAQAAKSGRDTSGFEIAANKKGYLATPEPTPATASQPPATYQTAAVTPETGKTAGLQGVQKEPLQSVIPGHTRNGQFYPDPVITEEAVTPSNIYVQAGSFSVHDNAVNLRNSLEPVGRAGVYPVEINGQHFYRVRLGPVSSVDQADELLARLVNTGHQDAIIVVE
ncbi:MAG: septal ring lytic transglycosylase RlpA family protein [Rhodospirillales bacterium]|nr:septal ring lytic transglycosylase RlpA family protein [Rhodospirillales bacterium]